MNHVIIIGGGAIGLGLAYHLAGRAQVTLVERGTLTSGTSWHAAGIVGPLRSTPNMTRLAMYAGELFPRLEEETGLSTGYRRTGGYWLARDPARMDELHRIASLGRHFGLTPAITDEIDIPGVDPTGIVGALHVKEDANVNPVDLCMAYARAARSRGAVIREGSAVADILVENGTAKGVRLAAGEEIMADQVALCAGAWSVPLARRAGLALPLQAVEHMYVVTEPMDLPAPCPVLRDLDRGIYVKGDAGKLVIGGFERDAKCWDAFGPEGDRPFLELPEDWEQFAPFMEAALALIPALGDTGIQHFMNGPESFTHDTRPYIGAAPGTDNLFVAAGMNSVGVMSSAGVGRALADWMQDGLAPMDMWEVDIARADPLAADPRHMAARMQEAVADAFALHWPFRQPGSGRDLRRSVLHDHWAAQGAVFGVTAGWERALWYAGDQAQRDLPCSVGDQPWFPIARREAAVMRTGTALLDLSPFGKFDVTGPEALDLLNRLCTAQMDVAVGRAVYTQMLNPRGGIEMDLTVTRTGPDRFRLTSGAATRWRDMAWLRRHGAGRGIEIADVTEDEAVIGVMGAGSRTLLSRLGPDDWRSFPFATARDVTLAGQPARATRLSFVGELGWELSIPAAHAAAVFDALIAAGAQPMGHYALDACRIEKGFCHWGHDLGPEITPQEAGLGFATDPDKGFLGKAALGDPRQRLVLLALQTHPLILHDEPIWQGSRVIGLTTSGARGARTGLTLALGLIEANADATHVGIEVAGIRHTARSLVRPPFDPGSERMRA